MSNIINAIFDGSRRKAITCPLFQYDYGQILKISGIELPASYQVQFSNTEDAGVSKTMLGDADGVQIPDEYLLTGDYIYAFVYLHETEDDGETEYVIEIPVIRRPVPSEETPTPAEQSLIDQLLAQLNQGVEAAEAAAEQAGQAAETAVEGMIDDTLTIQGKAADAKATGDEITQLKSDLAEIEPGLSDDAKAALLNCFAHTVFTDDDADYYGILRNALYADAYPRITAIFNPGTHLVYQGDTLDSLKPYLTVKYYEDSSSTETVIAGSDYTLSGTLVEGDQTITVRYTGLSATFTVSVTNPFLYRLPNTPVTFDGNTGIDTGLALLAENRSFTLAWEFVDRRNYTFDTTNNYPFGCYVPNSPYTGIFMQVYDGGVGSASNRRKIRHVVRCTPPGNSGGGQVIFDNDIAETDVVGRVIRFCFRYDSDSGTVKALFSVNKGTVTQNVDSIVYTYTAIDSKLIVGARMGSSSMANFMIGECNDFRVYDSAITDEEMQAYIEGVA